ncbi:hypothetical protein CMQ_2846 [Grosmannia clavigera kw1407]|uniref:Uncharacterized protein n=1 Tax=Grosmannia clavigera (strain kw1407 / UAMH 11150) TaxID=655863 RepID=F0XHY1_GROCL|nr:uncharacterized protein CMQ_2846 [Grosmannia clavigera kw1407]EFX02917.1 hypothetical protein CMQ_2846 [Grosmannia clavigera kw1407]
MASLRTDSVWNEAGLDVARFEAYAKLLCLRNGGQVEETSMYVDLNNDDDDIINDQVDISSLASAEKGGKQVACCMMVEWPDHVDVLVAKNKAFAENEPGIPMLQELASALREISKFDMHVLNTIMPATTTGESAQLSDNYRDLTTTLRLFHRLVTNAEYLDTLEGWDEAVRIASKVLTQCSELDTIANPNTAEKLANALGYLSRPLTCYNTFIRAAQRMSSFESVEILPVSTTGLGGSDARRKKRKPVPAEVWTAGKVFEALSLPLNDTTAERVLGNGTKRQTWTRNKLIQRYTSHKTLPPTEVHAEVQILLAAQRHNCIGARIVPYIGCSKRSCLLCTEFVQALGPYATRGCHGKLYSRWTVPPVSWMTGPQRQSLARSLHHMEETMKQRLLHPAMSDRPLLHVPESTIGGSSMATIKIQTTRQGSVAQLIEQRLSDQLEDAIHRWFERNSSDRDDADTFDHVESSDVIPEDPETREDFGMDRLSHRREESHLLGLYQGLCHLNVGPTDLDEWRRTGVLVDKIIEKFETIPEDCRGLYFPWFVRNKHILDPTVPLVSREKREEEAVWQAIVSAQQRLEPPYRDMDWRKMEPLSLRYCFLFYALSLDGCHPNPNAHYDDMWYDFGFAVCGHNFAEMQLCTLYGQLFGGDKAQRDYEKSLGCGRLFGGSSDHQQRLCPFLEFWKAYEDGTLPELFDGYDLGYQLDRFHHARLFLAARPDMSGCVRPPVWGLRHLLALDDASAESALRFGGAYPLIEAAIEQFGFQPRLDARAKVELKRFYGSLLEKSDILVVQEAMETGQLLDHALDLLGSNGVDESVRNILKRMKSEEKKKITRDT